MVFRLGVMKPLQRHLVTVARYVQTQTSLKMANLKMAPQVGYLITTQREKLLLKVFQTHLYREKNL